MPRPDLKVINSQTGEVVEDDRDVLIEQLKSENVGKSLQLGKLKKELKELRSVEPEAEVIKEVLHYWQEKCFPGAQIAIGGKRWEKVRARLRERLEDREPWTPAELKLAIDGALLDPWLNGTAPNSKGYLKQAETIFRDSEQVERLIHLATNFKGNTGVGIGDLIDFSKEMGFVDWKLLLSICSCGHRRIEHAAPDPTLEGRELCRACECGEFDIDPFEKFNGLL